MLGKELQLLSKGMLLLSEGVLLLSKGTRLLSKLEIKKDLSKRTGPLNLYQCDNYSSTAPCAAANRC